MDSILNMLEKAPYNVKVIEFDELPSTNKYAVEYAREGGECALVIAKTQSAGRGRLNRSFSSLTGGLYMSLLIRPDLKASDILKITPLAAVASVRAIKKLTGIEPKIKWVNDLYIGERKLAGILTEGAFTADGALDYAVVGIGVNINDVDFPPEIKNIATTLSAHTKSLPTPEELGGQIAKELLDILALQDFTGTLDEYRALSMLKGRTVTVNKYSESYKATVIDIDEDINLVLMLADGSIEHLSTDEISINL
jgi:BirA family biotin operon repressor/biotin-[acetyl-CoA-carboxylase] ligase